MNKVVIVIAIFCAACSNDSPDNGGTLDSTNNQADIQKKEAREYISIYERGKGSVSDWFARNSHTSGVIRISVKFTHSSPSVAPYTQSFDLQPGEEKFLVNKTTDGVHKTYATLNSAVYL